ncbi:AraC family transcriptional regulator [Paenibacillus doosanensis]|uniref:AraC family transcriptional regulator n=1 Tax=Paenibacillus doosanensis TaxID=1229154 RepID=UPI0021801000|nr:AraC family transcriptional regulator [Paenibacillus doosanensis]
MQQLFMISSIVGSIRLVDLQYTIGRKGYSFPTHRHSIFEFMYIISGTLHKWVGEQPLSLNAGDCLVIKPGQYHHTPPTPHEAEWFVLHFEIEDKTIREILQMLPYPVITQEEEESIHLFVRSFIAKYGYFLHNLTGEQASKPAESKYTAVQMLKVQSAILSLIGLLATYAYTRTEELGLASAQPAVKPSQIHLAHEAAYWIEKQAAHNMRIGELAAQLHVDRCHLATSFKKVYGVSPRYYLTQVKMRRAKELLIDTDWSVEKIAEELQFSSPSHFVKFFHKAAGQTPFRFRNHSR